MSSKIVKYGKKFQDISSIKKNFLFENDILLKKQKKIAKLYTNQPIRKKCKLCEKILLGRSFFNHNIEYIQCKKCSHVNGKFKDTDSFSKKIYESEDINYSKTYKSNDYQKFLNRKKKIYDPKAKFLKKCLNKNKSIKILDFGCGSGYFVSSLIDHGFKSVHGVEVSQQQINYGKSVFRKNKKNPKLLRCEKREKVFDVISHTKANCLTLIGVLEHIVDIHDFLNKIKKNKNIKFIFLCVPMFSLSSLIENNFINIFNRQLGGGHTHLFTEKSLLKLMNKYSFYEKGSWWFGTDIPDLLRSFRVQITKNKSPGLNKTINDLEKITDDLQMQIDKKKLSSQVHMFLERKKNSGK